MPLGMGRAAGRLASRGVGAWRLNWYTLGVVQGGVSESWGRRRGGLHSRLMPLGTTGAARGEPQRVPGSAAPSAQASSLSGQN